MIERNCITTHVRLIAVISLKLLICICYDSVLLMLNTCYSHSGSSPFYEHISLCEVHKSIFMCHLNANMNKWNRNWNGNENWKPNIIFNILWFMVIWVWKHLKFAHFVFHYVGEKSTIEKRATTNCSVPDRMTKKAINLFIKCHLDIQLNISG